MNIIIEKQYSLINEDIEIIKEKSNKKVKTSDLNFARTTISLDKIKTHREYFKKIITTLNLEKEKNIPWKCLLSKKNIRQYNNYLASCIDNTQKYYTIYFLKYFNQRLSLFEKLVPLGNLEKPVYEHNTTTGRLRVTSGTNYLTMKKNEKLKLKSSFDNHTLMELDFKSCEPNFYLRYIGKAISNDDVYDYISKEANIKNIDRAKIKRGILAIIYGADKRTVNKMSGMSFENIKKVKSLFDIENFKNKLEETFSDLGYFKNYYERPLMSNNNLVNHWIQSSAADFCCFAFNSFFNQNTFLKLHAVIHDAIIFSCPNNKVEEVMATKELHDKISNFSIPVKISKVVNNY